MFDSNSIFAHHLILLTSYVLQVLHTFVFEKGQDMTAMAFIRDNTNLLISTTYKQFTVITDPMAFPFHINFHSSDSTGILGAFDIDAQYEIIY